MNFLLMSLLTSTVCVYMSLVIVYKPLLVDQNNTYNGYCMLRQYSSSFFFTKKK